MASASSSARSYCYNSDYVLIILLIICLGWASGCYGFGSVGFDIHPLYSDPVKGIMAVDDLPARGSFAYYSAMVHRDRVFHGRQLAMENDQTPITFSNGNDTYKLALLGFLYYANVSLGTPALSYLVALDTGSDVFWLPCDCSSCVAGFKFSSGEVIEFNIYSPNTSSTSSKVTCSSTLCELASSCPSASSSCPYQVRYVSEDTSSSGILVEDVLHLITNDNQAKAVDARISFGCGQIQTGSFLDGAAPNGLFGLGMDKTSVPSILASQGLISNSFSLCFQSDGVGRISFGDKGSSGQGETPFYLRKSHPTYNITVTQISVGDKATDLEFSAIFDSGTSFTYLKDPAYTKITQIFNTVAAEKRFTSKNDLPFEYCYVSSSNQTDIKFPGVNLMMKGGDPFYVNNPIVEVISKDLNISCLAVVKSEDFNIIGQNFMTGYRIVFDREKNVLGWKESSCYDDNSTLMSINPPSASPIPPATAIKPEASAGNDNNSPTSAPASMGSHSPKLHPFTSALLATVLFSVWTII